MESRGLKEHYERYYKIALNMCENAQTNTTDELMNAVVTAKEMRGYLAGMRMLMESCGEMSREEYKEEEKRALRDFDTSRLYGVILTSHGEMLQC